MFNHMLHFFYGIMIILFSLFCLIESRTTSFLDSPIEVVFIEPTNQVFEIPQIFLNFPNSTFKVKKVSINKWEHQKKYCQKNIPYIAILRTPEVLFCEPFQQDKIQEYLLDIVFSRFSFVKNIDDRNTSVQEGYFLLTSEKIPLEYEKVAYLYHNYSQYSFYHQFNNQDAFRLEFCQFGECISMSMNNTIQDFVNDCITNIKTFQKGYSLVVVSDNANKQITELYLSEFRSSFKDAFPIKYMSWSDFEPYRKIANVSRSDTSYFIIYQSQNITNCWMYPDEDIISPHLLVGFFKRIYTGQFNYSSLLFLDLKPEVTKLIPEITNISRYVPSDKCSVVIFRNPQSWSDFDVLTTFQDVVKKNKRRDINFFSINQNTFLGAWYVPYLDGFPSIVLWKPNDQRPFMYNKNINKDDITQWIDALC